MEGSPIGDGAPEAMDAVAVHDHTGAENRWIADGLLVQSSLAIRGQIDHLQQGLDR